MERAFARPIGGAGTDSNVFPDRRESNVVARANMIERLIPKYPVFLVTGLLIVVSGLFLLMAGRDALIAIWVDQFFDGDAQGGLFQAAQTAERAIGHTLTVWFVVGLSFIKLGIGFAIATIVRNLRATGRLSLQAYSAAGLVGADPAGWQEPWFGRVFTRFLFSGILVVGFFFLLTLWWDANLVLLKNAEFDGRTTGPAYNTYLMTERVLSAVIGGGKFLGEGLLIFGILTGLATIIWNLSLQTRALPQFTRRLLDPTGSVEGAEQPQPFIPSTLINLGIAGFAVVALATPLALIRAGFVGWSLGRQFEGSLSETALRLEGTLGRTVDAVTNLGLGILFFTIALLLLVIIRWLRQQRQGFGEVVAELSTGALSRPVVEPPLWPSRLVTPLAIFGIFVVGFFFFTMTGVHSLNFNSLLSFQFAGQTDGELYQSALRFDRVLGPVISATRFIGLAALMVAIGLALVTIVINLRATAMSLPSGFAKLIAVARGERAEAADEDELTVFQPMALAPWNLFLPLLAGALVVVSGTLPVVILYGWSIHRMLGEQFAGAGAVGATSGLFESTFLATNLYGASMVPWMLFGMGIILFSVGRFFSTIVGFVEARRMVIVEGTEAIAEAVTSARIKTEEKAQVRSESSLDGLDRAPTQIPNRGYP